MIHKNSTSNALNILQQLSAFHRGVRNQLFKVELGSNWMHYFFSNLLTKIEGLHPIHHSEKVLYRERTVTTVSLSFNRHCLFKSLLIFVILVARENSSFWLDHPNADNEKLQTFFMLHDNEHRAFEIFFNITI